MSLVPLPPPPPQEQEEMRRLPSQTGDQLRTMLLFARGAIHLMSFTTAEVSCRGVEEWRPVSHLNTLYHSMP